MAYIQTFENLVTYRYYVLQVTAKELKKKKCMHMTDFSGLHFQTRSKVSRV